MTDILALLTVIQQPSLKKRDDDTVSNMALVFSWSVVTFELLLSSPTPLQRSGDNQHLYVVGEEGDHRRKLGK